MSTLRIRGARQHNLAAVDLDLPVDGFVVLCGRSGSGKSSLAFDTVHAEGQRRYLEALSPRLRATVGSLPRPDVDVVQGLPPTIALEQDVAAPAGASTLGSYADVDPVLRVLFGRAGVLRDPSTGARVEVSPHDAIVQRLLEAPEGTRLLLEAPVAWSGSGQGVLDEIARAGFSRVRIDGRVRRLDEVTADAVPEGAALRVVVDRIKVRPDRRDRLDDAVRTTSDAGHGVVVAVLDERETLRFADRPLAEDGTALPSLRPGLFRAPGPDACEACDGRGRVDAGRCEACGGHGLGPVAAAVTYEGLTLPQVWEEPLEQLAERLRDWPRGSVSAPVLDELTARIAALVDVGLGHLSLGRATASLSGGELQRLRLARQVGSELSGVLFVLDEPTAGLGGPQVARLVAVLRRLAERGNGLLVVEHHPDVIRAAERVIEFGPGPGREGGRVIFDGTSDELADADTPTGRALRAPPAWSPRGRTPEGWIRVAGARGRNLAGDAFAVAVGVLNVVSGPSGAGKTALLDALERRLRQGLEDPAAALPGAASLQRVLVVDERSARRSARSMPATYVGLWDTMRELLAATREAQVRALSASHFSLNRPGGRCEACGGRGERRIELHVLPDVHVPCEVCEGRRFAADVLQVTWKGRSAAELLDLDADAALPLLAGHPALEAALRSLREVGLGYVPLGQPAHTLSGGEARRLKLARELVRAVRRGAADTVFLLDDPTSGLHPEDVGVLVALLQRLVDEGATVVVGTHHEGLGEAADHRIVVGPGSGPDGGHVLRGSVDDA